jgi:hypothetical protein
MALLRTYRFIEKDPVIDELRTLVNEEGLSRRLNIVAILANLHPSTVKNMFHGDTKKPQNATVMGIVTSLGYARKWVKERKLNIDEEVEIAVTWNAREKEKRLANGPVRKKKRA